MHYTASCTRRNGAEDGTSATKTVQRVEKGGRGGRCTAVYEVAGDAGKGAGEESPNVKRTRRVLR